MNLSYSSISTFERCPLQYRFTYLDRLPKKSSPALSFGSSVHSALENFFDKKKGEPVSANELIEILDFNWVRDGYKDIHEEWQYRKEAEVLLREYHRLNSKSFTPPAEVESRFGVCLKEMAEIFCPDSINGDFFIIDEHRKVKANSITLTGVIDRIDFNEGNYEIVDYKTRRKPPQKKWLKDDIQLPLYQIGCISGLGIDPTKLSYYFLFTNTKYTTAAKDSGDIKGLVSRIAENARRIYEGDFIPFENNLCDWCDYFDFCPEKNSKQSVLESLLHLHKACDADSKSSMRQLKSIENTIKNLLPNISRQELDEINIKFEICESGEIAFHD